MRHSTAFLKRCRSHFLVGALAQEWSNHREESSHYSYEHATCHHTRLLCDSRFGIWCPGLQAEQSGSPIPARGPTGPLTSELHTATFVNFSIPPSSATTFDRICEPKGNTQRIRELSLGPRLPERFSPRQGVHAQTTAAMLAVCWDSQIWCKSWTDRLMAGGDTSKVSTSPPESHMWNVCAPGCGEWPPSSCSRC